MMTCRGSGVDGGGGAVGWWYMCVDSTVALLIRSRNGHDDCLHLIKIYLTLLVSMSGPAVRPGAMKRVQPSICMCCRCEEKEKRRKDCATYAVAWHVRDDCVMLP